MKPCRTEVLTPWPVRVAHLSDQVVLRVGHVHCVSSDGHALRGVEERLRQVSISPPAHRTYQSRAWHTPRVSHLTFNLVRAMY